MDDQKQKTEEEIKKDSQNEAVQEDLQEESDNSDKQASEETSKEESVEENSKTEETPTEETSKGQEAPEDKKDSAEETEEPKPSKPQKDVKGARWYVVHTYSGHEAKVAATLKQRVEAQKLDDKILDILVPTQEKIEIKEGKKTKVKEKIFPGYLLIRMVLDDNTWLAVRTTPGITSFIGNFNKPTPIPEEEVAGIKKFMAMEAPKFKAAFSVGEAVRIIDGPFSEFLGSISEIDEEKGKLKLMVSIFGRETPVELDFMQVAKL